MSGRPWRGALAEASEMAYEDERGEDERSAYEAWVAREREDNLKVNALCEGVYRPGGDNPGIYQCERCGAVAVRLRPKP